MRSQMFWLVATLAMLAFPVSLWSRTAAGQRLHDARSPIDLTHPALGAQWQFLDAALRQIPPGESFTVLAVTPDEEMSLFMIAIGLGRGRRALPSSYWSAPRPEAGGLARFVLVYRPDADCPSGSTLVGRAAGGCICDRRGATRG